MFAVSLITNEARTALIIFFLILGLILALYIAIIITSFAFMRQFKKDIKRRKDFINLLIFQKNDLLYKLSIILEKYLSKEDSLSEYINDEDLHLYKKLDAKEFEDFYMFTEKMLQNAQKIYINNNLEADKSKVDEIFLTIAELNDKYFQAVQLYNTSVVGYNYWYNLFSTKRIKKILFIKTIETIK